MHFYRDLIDKIHKFQEKQKKLTYFLRTLTLIKITKPDKLLRIKLKNYSAKLFITRRGAIWGSRTPKFGPKKRFGSESIRFILRIKRRTKLTHVEQKFEQRATSECMLVDKKKYDSQKDLRSYFFDWLFNNEKFDVTYASLVKPLFVAIFAFSEMELQKAAGFVLFRAKPSEESKFEFLVLKNSQHLSWCPPKGILNFSVPVQQFLCLISI